MVVDASVAIKWFVGEDRAGDALALLAPGLHLVAPRFIILEVAHVLWKGERRGSIVDGTLNAALVTMDRLFTAGPRTDDLTVRSIALTAQVGLAVFDCLYLALAEREGLTLVTADERQFAAARKARIPARLL